MVDEALANLKIPQMIDWDNYKVSRMHMIQNELLKRRIMIDFSLLSTFDNSGDLPKNLHEL